MIDENTNAESTRQVFYDAWAKACQGQPLTALEAQVVAVIEDHPEYQAMVEKHQTVPEDPAENPFLHMGLHLAIREQVSTNRPAGISGIYKTLCRTKLDALVVEHYMMGCLAEILWDAQQVGKMPDEQRYLTLLNELKQGWREK